MTKLVYGVGINDVDCTVTSKINAKIIVRREYANWHGMLRRCYSEEYQMTRPTYAGCTVAPEWHKFSNFKAWHNQQNYTEGLELDKDIIYPGNKVYGPDKCVYVSDELNKLLIKSTANRGKYPIGVVKHPNKGKQVKLFRSRIKMNGKYVSLGYYQTPEEAHEVYVQAKIKYIQDYYLTKETDQRIIDGLNRWIDVLRNGMYDLV
jgi:hypothetical protein